jgi:organic radical activating enzyme
MRFHDPERAYLPIRIDRPTPYAVIDGRIYSEACELSITEHCNFTCRACCHLSPVIPKEALPPEDIAKDLSLLAQYYRVEHVRLVGGEPFLHPQLTDVIAAVRSSGITSRIRVITNGSLPQRMTPKIWTMIDEIHISIYPGKEPSAATLQLFRQLADEHGTDLVIKHFNWFRESYSELGIDDDTLVRRIYQTCQIAHIWRCHTVRHGYFYRCPQSVFIPRIISGGESHLEDRLAITGSPDFGERLLAFLERPEPLAACRHCLGSSGKIFEHSQVARSGWRDLQRSPAEDMLDRPFLEHLEHQNPDADNGCWVTAS